MSSRHHINHCDQQGKCELQISVFNVVYMETVSEAPMTSFREASVIDGLANLLRSRLAVAN